MFALHDGAWPRSYTIRNIRNKQNSRIIRRSFRPGRVVPDNLPACPGAGPASWCNEQRSMEQGTTADFQTSELPWRLGHGPSLTSHSQLNRYGAFCHSRVRTMGLRLFLAPPRSRRFLGDLAAAFRRQRFRTVLATDEASLTGTLLPFLRGHRRGPKLGQRNRSRVLDTILHPLSL